MLFQYGKGFVNYGISVLMSGDEAEEMGIESSNISGNMRVGNYYRTDNDKVVNLITDDDYKWTFGQFVVEKGKEDKFDHYAGYGYYNNDLTKLLLGSGITKRKVLFFMLYMFPKSPFYLDGKEALREVYKEELNKKQISKRMLNDKFVERIFKQKWIKSIKDSPIGMFIMSNLKMALAEAGVDFKTVIDNYGRIASQESDMKAAVAANKELERLVIRSEEEDEKMRMISQISADNPEMEVAKRLNGEVAEIDMASIVEVGDELEELGDDYVNQNLTDNDEFVIESE
ncbi:MAG: hypothetical protein WC549_01900 [Actinomycetota bacterium]